MRTTLVLLSTASFLLVAGCSSPSSSSTTTTSIAPSVQVTGEPVTDFRLVAEARKAVDRSFLSVDKAGVYGVLVTGQFDFMKYMSTGWTSMTSSLEGITTSPTSQSIDQRVVTTAMDVTTRDYTRDRENDFLIRFKSGAQQFGAIASLSNGQFQLKPFCLTSPPPDRPGMIRVVAIENLGFSDLYRIIEGNNYDASGDSYRDYWKWSRVHGCFKNTVSLTK
jgi:hypothetical protein